MMTSSEVAKVYDTLLCIPGMNDLVKLDLKVSRRQVLLLTQVIERGVKAEAEKPSGIFSVLNEEGVKEISKISNDCLEKAGLTDLSKKLNNFEGI